LLNKRINASGDPDGFNTGAAVSPFKYTEGESFAQYAKLCRKVAAGAQFIITQLGYDVRKFDELRKMVEKMGIDVPILGSVYLLSPMAARTMNSGAIPGAVVPDELLAKVLKEWEDPKQGLMWSVERAARLAAILKGMGYRGIQIGGIHRSFEPVARILDRLEEIGGNWQEFLSEFSFGRINGFYAFPDELDDDDSGPRYNLSSYRISMKDTILFRFLQATHRYFFNPESSMAPFLENISRILDRHKSGRLLAAWMEGPVKKWLLDCKQCGDCGIQHVAFLCPESKCPKHIRNGSCGGSKDGGCEVYPDRKCVWFAAYERWASVNRVEEMTEGCVPPRMWELDNTPSWLNFYLKRDHQSASTGIAEFCRTRVCRSPKDLDKDKSGEDLLI
jgi:methylenetetrahydrofolate reductase (NADPH)